MLALTVDYFAKVWLNGELVVTLNQAHGSSKAPVMIALPLAAGSNQLLVKIASGSQGHQAGLALSLDA